MVQIGIKFSNFKDNAYECYKLVYGKDIKKKIDNINYDDFIFDPIQIEVDKKRMINDRKFREAMNTNMSPFFISYTTMKLSLKELYSTTVAGNTRTGKSVNVLGNLLFLHALENKPLPDTKRSAKKWIDMYICANQIEHAEKIKKLGDDDIGFSFQIDETLESERRFGIGSSALEINLQDQANIIAVQRLHTISISPRYFVLTQNPQYGLKTYGRIIPNEDDDSYAFNRCLLYDIGRPTEETIGFVVFPVFFMTNDDNWVRWVNEEYEKKKLKWVANERKQDNNPLMNMHIQMVDMVKNHELYPKAKTSSQKKALIRTLIGKQPNTVYKEIYDLLDDDSFLKDLKKICDR